MHKLIWKIVNHILTCTGGWQVFSQAEGDCLDVSDTIDIIISLEPRGRQLVGCLKNNLDARLSEKEIN